MKLQLLFTSLAFGLATASTIPQLWGGIGPQLSPVPSTANGNLTIAPLASNIINGTTHTAASEANTTTTTPSPASWDTATLRVETRTAPFEYSLRHIGHVVPGEGRWEDCCTGRRQRTDVGVSHCTGVHCDYRAAWKQCMGIL